MKMHNRGCPDCAIRRHPMPPLTGSLTPAAAMSGMMTLDIAGYSITATFDLSSTTGTIGIGLR